MLTKYTVKGVHIIYYYNRNNYIGIFVYYICTEETGVKVSDKIYIIITYRYILVFCIRI